MTKKDYEMIARVLAARKPTSDRDLCLPFWDGTCRDMALTLASTNPRFSKAAFLKACGVVPNENEWGDYSPRRTVPAT